MRFDLRAWCALLRAPGVGSKTYHTLLEAFGSPEAFFHAPKQQKTAVYCPKQPKIT